MPTARLGTYTVHYSHQEEYHHLKREIWGGHCYYTELAAENPVIIDAGAHIGVATLYFAHLFPTATITALEPNPIARDLLEKNIWENRLEDRVTILPVALSDRAVSALLHHLGPDGWQLNANLTPNAWNGQALGETTEVETITLKSLLTQPIDLLKLDVEGAELAILKAARTSLNQVTELFVEFHPVSGNSLPELLALLKKSGFTTTVWQNQKEVKHPKNVRGLSLVQANRD